MDLEDPLVSEKPAKNRLFMDDGSGRSSGQTEDFVPVFSSEFFDDIAIRLCASMVGYVNDQKNAFIGQELGDYIGVSCKALNGSANHRIRWSDSGRWAVQTRHDSNSDLVDVFG